MLAGGRRTLPVQVADWRLGGERYARKFRYVLETGVEPGATLQQAEQDLAAARCTIAPFRYCLTEKEVVGGQAAGRAVARRKMTVAHTAPEPDGATRGFRARKGGRFRHEPGRILHLRAGGTAAARVECALAGS